MAPPEEVSAIESVLLAFQHEDAARDPQLHNYFVPTRSVRMITPGQSHVLVGEYGSGKTAVIEHLLTADQAPKGRYVIPIRLHADTFVDELLAARETKQYATFWEALVYLRTLYVLALQASGSLNTGAKGALIGKLRKLGLAPYGDIISRLAGTAAETLKKVKKIEVGKVFGIERFPPQPDAVDLSRYRQMCAEISPLVNEEFKSKKPTIVVDALDPPSYLLDEHAHLVAVLLRWLSKVTAETDDAVTFAVALPRALLETMERLGEHHPAQDRFRWLKWTNDEFKELIRARAAFVLGDDVEPEAWLKTTTGFTASTAHRLCFSRPRNYIKLVRLALEERLASPDDSASAIWERARISYSDQVLHFLGVEWAGHGLEGFQELVSMLTDLAPKVDEKGLKKGLDEIRKTGVLATRGTQFLIGRLTHWGLISAGSDGYRIHDTIKLAGRTA